MPLKLISVKFTFGLIPACTGLDQRASCFVRNRDSLIQELTESDFWKHVNFEDNPADILSRVKAIHLEIVSDLTTEAFLAALKQFVARRGQPIEIHSDNGRNFVAASNELRKILKALFKVQIEALLNSRPICPLSNDPNDVETLTPVHFLVGSSLVAVPDPHYTEIFMNRLRRW
ncbi:integrase catalytic domain-containing protein [Trichonephila clavipes]|nr:integrase catalytic domain-containing protein [Trichonephila clavipes]